MKQTLWTSLFACAAAFSLAAAPDPVRQAREQLALVKPEAARRVLADLKGNPKYDYAKNAAAIEALLAKIDQVRADLEKGDDAAKAAAVQLVEGYRKAMLANPVLDFDQILCVHRKINGPRGAFGGRGSGMNRPQRREPHGRAAHRLRERDRGALRPARRAEDARPLQARRQDLHRARPRPRL